MDMTSTQQLSYLTKNNYQIVIKPIANLFLYQTQENFPIVQIPTFFIESQNRTVENPDDPAYHEALALVEARKSLEAFNTLVNTCVDIDDNYLDDNEWKKHYRRLARANLIIEGLTEKQAFLQLVVLVNDEDKNNIVNLCALTESRVLKFYKAIQITKFGQPVEHIHVKNAIDTGVETKHLQIGQELIVTPLDEYDAAINSHISWGDWLKNFYSLEEKAAIVATYRLHRIKDMYIQDEQQIQAEKKNK